MSARFSLPRTGRAGLLWSAIGCLVIGLGAWAFVPVLPRLLAERQLADGLCLLAKDSAILSVGDEGVRSRVQQLARQKGFHLEFQDIFVRYLQSNDTEDVVPPSELGYTLSLTLPLFGFIDWSLVAVRSCKIAHAKSAETGRIGIP